MTACEGWREATAKIGFADTLNGALDLTQAQYEALHDGRLVTDLCVSSQEEFVIESVGRETDHRFQDIGIEYYRFQA